MRHAASVRSAGIRVRRAACAHTRTPVVTTHNLCHSKSLRRVPMRACLRARSVTEVRAQSAVSPLTAHVTDVTDVTDHMRSERTGGDPRSHRVQIERRSACMAAAVSRFLGSMHLVSASPEPGHRAISPARDSGPCGSEAAPGGSGRGGRWPRLMQGPAGAKGAREWCRCGRFSIRFPYLVVFYVFGVNMCSQRACRSNPATFAP